MVILQGKGPLEGEWRITIHRWSDRRNLSQASAEAVLDMQWQPTRETPVLRGLVVRASEPALGMRVTL